MERPAAIFETALGIFLGPARSLHDAIEADESRGFDLAHGNLPFIPLLLARSGLLHQE
jgi:hypothetical protein